MGFLCGQGGRAQQQQKSQDNPGPATVGMFVMVDRAEYCHGLVLETIGLTQTRKPASWSIMGDSRKFPLKD